MSTTDRIITARIEADSTVPLIFEDLGDGWTRLHAQSLVDSFEGRDAWLQSGMETA